MQKEVGREGGKLFSVAGTGVKKEHCLLYRYIPFKEKAVGVVSEIVTT